MKLVHQRAFEVGLVHAPGIADRPLIGLPAFLKLWDVANDPAQDCARGDADAEFPGQLGQLPVTKFKGLKCKYHRTQVPRALAPRGTMGQYLAYNTLE